MRDDTPPDDADADTSRQASGAPDPGSEEPDGEDATSERTIDDPGAAGATDTGTDPDATGSTESDETTGGVVANPGPGGLVGTVLHRVHAGVTGNGIAPDAPLSRGEVFEILSNERRRHVIRYLRDRDGTGELGDIATQVAAWELDIPLEDVSSTQRKRVYTTLQQTHLPKMDAIGAVSYDSNSGAVEAADVLEDVDIYLEIVPGGELAWKEYYLALSIVSLALVAVVAVDVFPFSVLPPIVWAGVIASAFLVSAAAHVYYDRSLEIGESP